MARLARPRRLERREAGPVAGFILFLCQPAADSDQRIGHFIMGTADRMLLKECRGGLPESAGVDLL